MSVTLASQSPIFQRWQTRDRDVMRSRREAKQERRRAEIEFTERVREGSIVVLGMRIFENRGRRECWGCHVEGRTWRVVRWEPAREGERIGVYRSTDNYCATCMKARFRKVKQ